MTIKTCTIQASGSIELFFYGELPAAERHAIETHVKSCAECQAALEELALIRSALASRPDVAAPPEGDWSGFMTRLDLAVKADRQVVPFDRKPLERSVTRVLASYLAAAALVALVTMSVLRVSRGTDGERIVPTAPPAPSTVAVNAPQVPAERDSALVALSEEHFKRSKLVVLGLTTKDASAVTASDWRYERELASTLLGDTRLYRRAAEDRGMNAIAGVMRDLELVLLQTSMSEAPDAASLEQIQRLIRRRDLVTKMDVVNSSGLLP